MQQNALMIWLKIIHLIIYYSNDQFLLRATHPRSKFYTKHAPSGPHKGRAFYHSRTISARSTFMSDDGKLEFDRWVEGGTRGGLLLMHHCTLVKSIKKAGLDAFKGQNISLRK